jgi:hypothetical protein
MCLLFILVRCSRLVVPKETMAPAQQPLDCGMTTLHIQPSMRGGCWWHFRGGGGGGDHGRATSAARPGAAL